MRYIILIIAFIFFGCGDEDNLEMDCEKAKLEFQGSLFSGTATYCYELPLDTMATTIEEVEVFVSFSSEDRIEIEIDYLDPLIQSYFIDAVYLCSDAENLGQIDFEFQNDIIDGEIRTHFGLINIRYASDTCSHSHLTAFLQ